MTPIEINQKIHLIIHPFPNIQLRQRGEVLRIFGISLGTFSIKDYIIIEEPILDYYSASPRWSKDFLIDNGIIL